MFLITIKFVCHLNIFLIDNYIYFFLYNIFKSQHHLVLVLPFYNIKNNFNILIFQISNIFLLIVYHLVLDFYQVLYFPFQYNYYFV